MTTSNQLPQFDFDFDDLNQHEVEGLVQRIDINTTGRVLRAHLVVEHFLNEHIAYRHKNVANIEDVKLTFAQKVALLDNQVPFIAQMKAGIKNLNRLRNKYAHKPDYVLVDDDVAPFLNTAFDVSVRRLVSKNPQQTPVVIIEAFAVVCSVFLRAGVMTAASMEKYQHEVRERYLVLKAREDALREAGLADVDLIGPEVKRAARLAGLTVPGESTET